MQVRTILISGLAALGLLVSTPSAANAAESAARTLPECENFSTFTVVGEDIAVHVTLPTAGPVESRQKECSLMLNDQGAGVLILQWALNRCHSAGLQPDGIYGPLTRNVILWAQASAGLAKDGIYGPKTRSWLKWPLYDESNDYYRCNYIGFFF